MTNSFGYKSLYLIVFCLVACNNNTPDDKAPQKTREGITHAPVKEIEKTYKVNTELNLLAQHCGFISPSDCSNQFSEWNELKVKADLTYNQIQAKSNLISNWRNQNLDSSLHKLFYPFSGPDFLHANILFPQADTIFMVGLEPVGSLSHLTSNICDKSYNKNLSNSLNMILNNSFFRTNSMAVNYKQKLDGTLPIFLHFFSRNEYEIVEINEVQINENAELSYKLSCDSCYNGVEYKVLKAGKLKSILYFSLNLSNADYTPIGEKVKIDGLQKHPEIISFLTKFGIQITYLKAASYLLHRPYFSIIREFILDQSSMILQDDSGIPLRFLSDKKWNSSYFGSYNKPIPLFAERYQQDLFDIYNSDSIQPASLQFGIGYKFRKGTSNLMIFNAIK